MTETEVISELKEFLRRYKAYKRSNKDYNLYVNMTVFLRERNAIAYALDVLERLNAAKEKENTYPENIFRLLGFDLTFGLSARQICGFDHIMTKILSELEAGVIEARYRDRKKNKEIAKMYNISSDTLGSRIRKIIDKLKTPEYLEILAGRNLPLGERASGFDEDKNEYMELYNRRIKAVDELRKEIENLETTVKTVHEQKESLGREEKQQLVDEALDSSLHIKIDDLDLSMRAYNILTRNGVWYVSDLKDWDYERLLGLRNCGVLTVEEIICKTAKYGIIKKPKE